jgi:hypothetical protein
MKQTFFLLFTFIFAKFGAFAASDIPHECQYYLSVCAMFKNEGPYLEEWIEYYLLQGVEKFYLYDNESSDNARQILDPYIKEGLVEYTFWPHRGDPKDYILKDQKRAYNECIKEVAGKTYWLAIVDIDEFIVPVDTPNLISYLHEFDKEPRLGGIKANWQLYGTSHLATLPKDKLMIECLVYKAPTDYKTETVPHNHIIKSIVRPHAIKEYNIHEGVYKQSFYVIPQGGKERFLPVQVDRLRINHYWTRADDFFYTVKIDRRCQYSKPDYYQTMLQKYADLNAVEDRIMDRFVQPLKDQIAKRRPHLGS